MDFIFKDKIGGNLYADCYTATSPAEGKGERDIIYRLKVIKPQFVNDTLKTHLQQQLCDLKQLNIENLFLPELIEENNAFIIIMAA